MYPDAVMLGAPGRHEDSTVLGNTSAKVQVSPSPSSTPRERSTTALERPAGGAGAPSSRRRWGPSAAPLAPNDSVGHLRKELDLAPDLFAKSVAHASAAMSASTVA